jgi:ankyrin repeat protein
MANICEDTNFQIKMLLEWCEEATYRKYANMQDKEGKSALHNAASFHQLDCIKVLLQYGADPNIKDEKGMTPLMIVSGGEEERVLEDGIRLMLNYVSGVPSYAFMIAF